MSVSILLPSVLLPAHPPSIVVRHRWLRDRLDSVLQGELVLIVEWSEFEEPGTSYLLVLAYWQGEPHGFWFTLKNIKTDSPQLVNVWVVNLCQEPYLWWSHRIVVWQEEFELEDAA